MKALFLIGTYVVVRFLLIERLDALSSNASYVFEVFFVATALFLYRKRLDWGFKKLDRRTSTASSECIAALGLGALTYKTSIWLKLVVPFNFNSGSAVFMILFFGPILEELIFRFALWYPLEDLLKKKTAVIVASALVFSFAHFFAYFYVPPLVAPFVLFQAIYTLIMGLWWGARFAKYKSIIVPVTLHIVFNLGFYLGYLADEPGREFGAALGLPAIQSLISIFQ